MEKSGTSENKTGNSVSKFKLKSLRVMFIFKKKTSSNKSERFWRLEMELVIVLRLFSLNNLKKKVTRKKKQFSNKD